MSLIIMDKICEFEVVDKFGLRCPEKVEQSNTWWYFPYPVTVEGFEIFSYLVFPRFVDLFIEPPSC